MSFTLCSSGAITAKAGVNVSSTLASSSALLIQLSDEAEGRLCAETRYDWVAKYDKVGTNFKPALADAASAYAAAMLAAMDLSGYTTRGEGEDVVNMNMDRFQRAAAFLAEDKNRKAMGATDT